MNNISYQIRFLVFNLVIKAPTASINSPALDPVALKESIAGIDGDETTASIFAFRVVCRFVIVEIACTPV
jgi:hypothetical protein